MTRRFREWRLGNHIFRSAVYFCGALFIVTTVGCWKRRPWTAEHMHGKASREMFSSQVINDRAPRDRTPAQTLPGDLSSDIYAKYKHDMITDDDKQSESGDKPLRFMMDLNQ